MKPNDPYQRWFFNSAYVAAGRPKMEEALMNYARKSYLDCLVYESYLPDIVQEIKDLQDVYFERNKRLKKVEIRLSENDGSDTRWLHIGAMNLTLRKVRKEIDYT